MNEKPNNVEKYTDIVKAINSALPEGETSQWLTLVEKTNGNMDVMGECSDKTIVSMVCTLLVSRGLQDLVIATLALARPDK